MSLRTIESLRRVELSTTLVIPRLEALGQLAAQKYARARLAPLDFFQPGFSPLNLSPQNLGSNERSSLYDIEVAERQLAFIADALFCAKKPDEQLMLPPESRWVPNAAEFLGKHTNSGFEEAGYFTDLEGMASQHRSIYRRVMESVEPSVPHGRRGLSYARDVAEGRRVLRPLPRTILN